MRHTSKLLAQCLLVLATMPAIGAAAQPKGPIHLNFKEAEVDSVVGAFGHLLNKSFVIDPRVNAQPAGLRIPAQYLPKGVGDAPASTFTRAKTLWH